MPRPVRLFATLSFFDLLADPPSVLPLEQKKRIERSTLFYVLSYLAQILSKPILDFDLLLELTVDTRVRLRPRTLPRRNLF